MKSSSMVFGELGAKPGGLQKARPHVRAERNAISGAAHQHVPRRPPPEIHVRLAAANSREAQRIKQGALIARPQVMSGMRKWYE